jgi:uncharacterized protein (TIGR03437 family)
MNLLTKTTISRRKTMQALLRAGSAALFIPGWDEGIEAADTCVPATPTVTVTIGGIPAVVSFAGLVGPGLYQINVTVPATLADGDHAVIATVAGFSSQSVRC